MPANNLNKHKKQAQHIVEFTLMLPMFIILCAFAFQLMVETYVKYKFSYIFSGAINQTIRTQPVFETKEEMSNYSLRNEIEEKTKNSAINVYGLPYNNIHISTINSPNAIYVVGAFQYIGQRIFFSKTGLEYFYFIIPVNRAFLTPLVLDKTTDNLEEYFAHYYSFDSEKTKEQAVENDNEEEGVLGG